MKKLSLISYSLLGFLVFFTILELALRFMPVNHEPARRVSAKLPHHVVFQPNTEFTYSRTWNFSVLNRGVMNSEGFHSHANFPADGARINIVIGDSYVDAAMIPYEETLQAKLSELSKEGGGVRYIGLGLPGLSAADYLDLLSKACRRWTVGKVVIVMNESDFTESRVGFKGRYKFTGSGEQVEVEYVPRAQQGQLIRILKHSYLVRYIIGNLGLKPDRIKSLIIEHELKKSWMENASSVDVKKSESGETFTYIDQSHFLRKAREIQEGEGCCLTLLLNAEIESAIAGAENSDCSDYEENFRNLANEYDVNAISVKPVIQKLFKLKKRPRFLKDGHWSSCAHGAIAEMVYDITSEN